MQRQKYKKITLMSLVITLMILAISNVGSLEHSKLLWYGFFLAAALTVIYSLLWASMPITTTAQKDFNAAQGYRAGNTILKEIRVATIINFILLILAGLNYQSTKDSEVWAGMIYVIVTPIVSVIGIFCLISIAKLIRNPALYNISTSKAWSYALLSAAPYLVGYGIANLPSAI